MCLPIKLYHHQQQAGGCHASVVAEISHNDKQPFTPAAAYAGDENIMQ
jgi:hypothetical protein